MSPVPRSTSYVIAGAGAYRLECTGDITWGAATKFGWNGGLGTKAALIGGKWFLESRFHSIKSSGRYVAFTLGLTL